MTFLDPFILPVIVVRPFCVLRRCDNSAGATERKEAREGGTLAAYNLCVPSFHWIWTSLVCQSETTGLTGPFRLVGGPTANRSTWKEVKPIKNQGLLTGCMADRMSPYNYFSQPHC
jgi:hypothetical protein